VVLFTGINVTLVGYVSPLMSFSLNNPPLPDIPVPFFPSLALHVSVNNLTVSGQVAFGYDTKGFLANPAKPDPLEGMYLYNPDPKNQVYTGVHISGGISLDLVIDQGLYAVGVGGSISTGNQPALLGLDDDHVHLDQNNQTVPDFDLATVNGQSINVVRYDNLKYLAGQGSVCPLFNAQGQLGLSLNGYVRIGIPPFDFQVSQDYGFIPVWNFANLCSMGQNPGLGSFDPSTGTLVLNWAANAGQRNVMKGPQPSETFDVSPVPDPQHPGQFVPGEVIVSAFGYTQVFGAPTANGQTPVTTIVGLGEDNSDTTIAKESVMIEQGVTANAVLVAGSGTKDLKSTLRYQGDGNAWLFGGGAEQNFLAGGNGRNVIVGGDNGLLGGGYPGDPQMPNVLVGGTGPNSHNIIIGQEGGATLTAGPNDGDILIGGSGFIDASQTFHPSSFTLNAGKGSDGLVGGQGGINYFQWQEGDGDTTIYGGNPNLSLAAYRNNFLDIQGLQGHEQWTVNRVAAPPPVLPNNFTLVPPPYTNGVPQEPAVMNPTSNVQGVQIQGMIPGQSTPATITAANLDDLSIDTPGADPNHPAVAGPGGNTYTINDVTGTGLHYINVNLHEASAPSGSATPDANPNTIVVNGSTQFANTVQVDSDLFQTGTTQVTVTPNVPPGPSGGALPGDFYQVTTAIPQVGDNLSVNTFGGNDQVTVLSTQGLGSTNINTGAGDDSITVGGSTGVSLDAIMGPLHIDAGAGDFNRVLFTEATSTQGDTVALTSSQLVRVNPQPLPPYFVDTYFGRRTVSQRYPMHITYQAMGGHFESGGPFGGGVELDTTQGADTVSVPNDLALAPTTVNTSGGAGDQVFVGFDHFPNGQKENASTLDNLPSTLTVQGSPGQNTSLDIADEASTQAESYVVDDNVVFRTSAPGATIDYSDLGGLTLNAAASRNNSIWVDGTAQGTATTVNAGDGDNTLTVHHDTINGHVLDYVQGRLTLNGGGGTDALSLLDDGNTAGQSYVLGAGFLDRLGPPPVDINFSKISGLDLLLPAAANLSNTITAAGTPSGVPVKVETGGGTNQINVTDTQLGTIDGIQGPLTFSETSGAQNTMAVDDSGLVLGPPVSETYEVDITASGGTLTRGGIATIMFAPLVSFTLKVRGNSNNTVNVDATAQGSPVLIDGGTVTNDVVVGDPQAGTLDSIGGDLAVHGAAGAASTVVSLEDKKAAAGRSYTIDSGEFQAGSPIAPVTFDHLTGLVLDAGNQGNQIAVNGTAVGNHVTVNAGTNDLIQVGLATSSLQPIQGRVDVVGTGTNDKLNIIDTNGSPMAAYDLTAAELDHPPTAPVGYQGLAGVLLEGSDNGDVYHVEGIPPATKVRIAAAGGGNALIGPDTNNLWEFQSSQNTLDGRVTFSGIQGLQGGADNDTFKFEGVTFNGTIDGGGGDNTLDTSEMKAEQITLKRGAVSGNGFYGWVSSVADTIDEIDALVSLTGDGSTVDGSSPNFTGDFTSKLSAGTSAAPTRPPSRPCLAHRSTPIRRHSIRKVSIKCS